MQILLARNVANFIMFLCVLNIKISAIKNKNYEIVNLALNMSWLK